MKKEMGIYMNFAQLKAPEGATHFNPSARTVFWYRLSGSRWQHLKAGRWVRSHDKQSVIDGLVAVDAPAELEQWSGSGLPPVGTVCEQQTWVNREWREVTVVAHFNKFAVCAWQEGDDDNQVELAPAGDLRPIRTPEQIASEERENELNRMVATVSMLDKGWARKVCAGLYDAGYRKPAN